MAAHPGSNLPRCKKDSGPLREAAMIYLPMSGGGRHGEAWEMGHNFGETVRFWLFVRRKGLHVHVSLHTELYCPFKSHLPQGPQGSLWYLLLLLPRPFCSTLCKTYPPILSHTCIHLLINIMLINIIRREPK